MHWIEAAQKNTDPENLYIAQINSFEDLKKRLEKSKNQAEILNKRLFKDIDALNKYKQACDDDLLAKISESHRKNELVAQKMISVYGKFEEYLSTACGHSGSRGLVKAEHDSLNQKYEEQLNQIQDPRVGLLKKLRDLQTRIKIGMQHLPERDNYSTSQVRSQIERSGEEIGAEDLKDLFAVLKGQKQGL